MFFQRKKKLRKQLWQARVISNGPATAPPPVQQQYQQQQQHNMTMGRSSEIASQCWPPPCCPTFYEPPVIAIDSVDQCDREPCEDTEMTWEPTISCPNNNNHQHHHHDHPSILDYQGQRSTTMTSWSRKGSSSGAGAGLCIVNCCGGGSSSSSVAGSICGDDQAQFEKLATILDVRQMELLLQIVRSSSAEEQQPKRQTRQTVAASQNCVKVPSQTIFNEDPHVIACRLWRWPNLHSGDELKPIPSCPPSKDLVCCNPNHWSRLQQPETPPPPYCATMMADRRLGVVGQKVASSPASKSNDAAEDAEQEEEDWSRYQHRDLSLNREQNHQLKGFEDDGDDRLSSKFRPGVTGSFTTDGEDHNNSTTSSSWCLLAYWEQSVRVGRKCPVESPSINVFSDQPRGDGICLATLASKRDTKAPDSVQSTRQKIGLGITLSQERDGMWIYNRSQAPVFVHSPTLCDTVDMTRTFSSSSLLVIKLLPGHCMRAYNPKRANSEYFNMVPGNGFYQTGPIDRHSVRISFVKGWGPNYKRQDVQSCPCWLEVMLTRRRDR